MVLVTPQHQTTYASPPFHSHFISAHAQLRSKPMMLIPIDNLISNRTAIAECDKNSTPIQSIRSVVMINIIKSNHNNSNRDLRNSGNTR